MKIHAVGTHKKYLSKALMIFRNKKNISTFLLKKPPKKPQKTTLIYNWAQLFKAKDIVS